MSHVDQDELITEDDSAAAEELFDFSFDDLTSNGDGPAVDEAFEGIEFPDPPVNFDAPLVIGQAGKLATECGAGALPGHDGLHDIVLDERACEGLEIKAASLRGLAHRFFGTTRQDAYWVESLSNEGVAFCVADGMGSYSESHQVATFVVRHTTKSLVGGASPAEAITAVNESLQNVLPPEGERPLGVATVICGVVLPHDNELQVTYCAIGDTQLYVLENGVFGAPESSEVAAEIATSSTSGVPSKTHQDGLVSKIVRTTGAVFVVSDGVGDLIQSSSTARRKLATAFETPKSLFEFAHTVNFASRSIDDDRTVVGFWPTKQSSIKHN